MKPMTARNDPFAGAGYLVRGLSMITRPGLRRYLVVPLLVNVAIFSLVAWIGYVQFEALLDWLIPESGWLSFLRWLLWPLFALAVVLITCYAFTIIANLIAAPFNGLLAAKVETIVTGRPPPEGQERFAATILPSLVSELRKLGYFLIRALPLLLLFLIPGVNLAAPVLWLAFGFWFLTLEYADYPLANHGLRFTEQRRWMRSRRLTALGFGGAVTLLMMIPLVAFVAMPAAVAGATLLICEQRSQAGAAEPKPAAR